MRALVLGATGATGRRTAAELARSDEIEVLYVGGRSRVALDELASLLSGRGRNVRPVTADASAPSPLAAAPEIDVCVACVGPSYLYEGALVADAIRRGCSYVSLCDDHTGTDAAVAQGAQAEQAGVTVVPGCGFSPGVTNLLVALAAGELDEVYEVDVSVAASSADTEGPAAAAHLLHMLAERAPYVSDRRRAEGRSATAPKPVYFPEPVGWVETFVCGHPEVVTLPRGLPDLRACRFRIGLTERAVMDAARAIVAARLASSERTRRLVMRAVAPVRPLLERMPPRGPSWTAARVDVHGIDEGRSATVSVGVVDHLANLAVIPLARAALEIGTGRCTKPGVHAPDEVFEARAFLKALAERGIRVARLEPYPV